jgi:DNA-binding NarL/FixJ family response regulator
MVPIRTLVVDDNTFFLKMMARFLTRDSQIQVIGCADSGQAALHQASATKVDLVLVDWDMPEMNGLELTRRLKELDRPPRIVILSLHDGEEYREAAVAQADGFLTKSLIDAHLLSLIHALFQDRLDTKREPSAAGREL